MSKIDWSKKPKWADGYAVVDDEYAGSHEVWFNDNQYQYLDNGKTYFFAQGWDKRHLSHEQYPPTQASRIDQIGQNGNDGLHYEDMPPEKRELNPPTSSLHHSQTVEIAKETGLCSDGRPCGEVHEFCQDAYCADCPNDPCNCDGCTDGDEEIPPPQYNPKDVAFAPSKYHRKINGKWCDVYDILQTWNVTNPALQHLIKKALQAGDRGHKDLETDMQDIIDSAVRAKELACNKNT